MSQLYRAVYTGCANGLDFQSRADLGDGLKLFSTSGNMGQPREVLSFIKREIERDTYDSGRRTYTDETWRYFYINNLSVLLHTRLMPKEETGSKIFCIVKALMGDFNHHPVEYISSKFFNENDFFFGYRDANDNEITTFKQLLTYHGHLFPPPFQPLPSDLFDHEWEQFKTSGFSNSYPVMKFEHTGAYVHKSKKLTKYLQAAVCHLVKQYGEPDENKRKCIVIRGTSDQIRFMFAAIGYAFSSFTAKKIGFSIGLPSAGFAYNFATSALVGWISSDPDVEKVSSLPHNLVYLEDLNPADEHAYYSTIAAFNEDHFGFVKPNVIEYLVISEPSDYPQKYQEAINEQEERKIAKIKREAAEKAEKELHARHNEDYNKACQLVEIGQYEEAIRSLKKIKTEFKDIQTNIENKIKLCNKKIKERNEREKAQKEMSITKTYESVCSSLKNAMSIAEYETAKNEFIQCQELIKKNKLVLSEVTSGCNEGIEKCNEIITTLKYAEEEQRKKEIEIEREKEENERLAKETTRIAKIDQIIKAIDGKITEAVKPSDLNNVIKLLNALDLKESDKELIRLRNETIELYNNKINVMREQSIRIVKQGELKGDFQYYTGWVMEDLPHGLGISVNPNGVTYIGFWNKGCPASWGTNFTHGMWVTTGEWDNKNHIRGFDISIIDNTNPANNYLISFKDLHDIKYDDQIDQWRCEGVYFGNTAPIGMYNGRKKNVPSGWGTLRFPDLYSWHTGEWNNGVPYGWGVFWDNRICNYKFGFWNGYGILTDYDKYIVRKLPDSMNDILISHQKYIVPRGDFSV